MADKLESGAVSTFCESIAMMLAAGIQTDEAVHLAAENVADSPYKRVCDHMYTLLADGSTLNKAMQETGAFPGYAVKMVAAGETSGHLENVLRSLAVYYSEEDRLFSKMRSAIMYPAGLLLVMDIILIFTVTSILPVFVRVYQSVSGDMMTGSFVYVNMAMTIGYLALAFIIVCSALAVYACIMASGTGRTKLMHIMERIPFSAEAMHTMALSRFTSALSTFVSAGIAHDRALKDSIEMTDHETLHLKAQAAYDAMVDPENPRGLARAIYDTEVFDPMYARTLLVGGQSGATESVLRNLSRTFFEEAVMKIDALIDVFEPVLAAFLTIAVGATLIAVMLPLIGIMGTLG